jgi:TonB family protein
MPIKSSHGREEDVLASGDGRPNHELEAGQPARSLHPLALLTAPVLKTSILPEYPPDAMHLFLDRDALAPKLRAETGQGRVVLKILVRADGSVANVDVATSTGIAILDDAAVRAAWGWQFEPATRDGQPITAWAFVPVQFVQR